MIETIAAILSRHVPDERNGGFHRNEHDPDEITYPCADCDQDWPCDILTMVGLAKVVLHDGIEERLTMASDPVSRRESIHGYIDAVFDPHMPSEEEEMSDD